MSTPQIIAQQRHIDLATATATAGATIAALSREAIAEIAELDSLIASAKDQARRARKVGLRDLATASVRSARACGDRRAVIFAGAAL